ncbi:hypothetical protein [Dongia sp.]|uniref:hypothetical protein n=1 Tax=Dongia sp. TaxID=1977262 RepID=UPI0035B3450A
MNSHEENVAIGKMAVAAGGATLYGLTLNEWVAIVTIIYIVAQAILLIPKYVAMFRAWRNRRAGKVVLPLADEDPRP